jgi:hypothetical protein
VSHWADALKELAMVVGSDQSQRVLALTRELVADIAAVNLDTIDGEFFWRICRAELSAPFHARRVPFPPLPEGPWNWAAYRPMLDAQQAHRRAWHVVMDEHPDLPLMIPDPVAAALLAGERVSMRPATVRWSIGIDRFRGEGILVVEIRAGTWLGRDVERAITWQFLHDPILGVSAFQTDPFAPPRGARDRGVEVRIAFAVHGDLSYAEHEPFFWGPGEFPYVEVLVPLPMPPPGTIAREYDAMVREQHAWHEQLPGGISKYQEKEVAIRTWAVGLLMASGRRHRDAMRDVCAVGVLAEVSQSCFGGDRRRLLERVPEARPYLRVMR